MPADGDEAQALAQRQYDRLLDIPGTPRNGNKLAKLYLTGLGDTYVADPRFTKTYDDRAPGLARYVHDAIHANADRNER